MNAASTKRTRPSIRWWPAGAVLALGALAFAINRFLPHVSRQHQIYAGGAIVACTLIALLIWLLVFSRIRWRSRMLIVFGVIALSGMAAAFIRIRGVSGDLLPLVEWRWNARRIAGLPTGTVSTRAPIVPPDAGAWPQFLGPTRNTLAPALSLERDWKSHPPNIVWRRDVGPAWSGFAVARGIAVTQEQRGAEEAVIAYELMSGNPIWSHGVSARYFTTLAGEGPRATPTIDGEKVFAQGATGILTCLDLVTGVVKWAKDVLAENSAGLPDWGFSCSPLVNQDGVIVSRGGKNGRSLVCYDRENGSVKWAGGDNSTTYSSPVAASLHATPQILVFASRALVGHDAGDARVLWAFPWPGGHPHCSAPVVVSPTDVVISSGYGIGAARLHVTRSDAGAWSAEEVWRTNKLRAKFTNFTEHRGHIYGLDDGIMTCLDAQNGERKWKDGRYGHGQQILCGDLLLVMAEDGNLVLIDPQPDALRELTRFRALNAKTWNPPALAGAYLLVRNDKQAACLRLPIH